MFDDIIIADDDRHKSGPDYGTYTQENGESRLATLLGIL